MERMERYGGFRTRSALALACVLALSFCSKAPEETVNPTAEMTSTDPVEVPGTDALAETSNPSEAPPVDQAAESTGSFDPAMATGVVVGVPAETNTAPIVAVANYYTEIPDFDLDVLTQRQREKFLQRVNSEMCTCGCKNDTLARCHVNDPKCPDVKGMIQQVYDKVR